VYALSSAFHPAGSSCRMRSSSVRGCHDCAQGRRRGRGVSCESRLPSTDDITEPTLRESDVRTGSREPDRSGIGHGDGTGTDRAAVIRQHQPRPSRWPKNLDGLVVHVVARAGRATADVDRNGWGQTGMAGRGTKAGGAKDEVSSGARGMTALCRARASGDNRLSVAS